RQALTAPAGDAKLVHRSPAVNPKLTSLTSKSLGCGVRHWQVAQGKGWNFGWFAEGFSVEISEENEYIENEIEIDCKVCFKSAFERSERRDKRHASTFGGISYE
ncbi:MAG: hypothetical protein IJ547_02125, partial [Clostridia bacterium]|nr:hypothetical protein [Clostridia bacterium]